MNKNDSLIEGESGRSGNGQVFEWDINAEIDRYLDESSLPCNEPPAFVILLGPPAGGKTTRRKQRYSSGYVVVDAAEIFFNLTRGEVFPFPGAFEEMLNLTGRLVARCAVTERRNIVTELINANVDVTFELIDAMQAIGYATSVEAIMCDLQEAKRRHEARDANNISCYYTEPYQHRWLLEAARAVQRQNAEGSRSGNGKGSTD